MSYKSGCGKCGYESNIRKCKKRNVDDEIDLSLSELNCKFQMLECKVDDASEEVQKFLDNSPTPTAYDCEEVKILLSKLSEAKDFLTENAIESKIKANRYDNVDKKAGAIQNEYIKRQAGRYHV